MTAADVRTQIARLRGSGASVFVIFTTPRFTIQSYAIANALRWSPAVIYTTQVSATDTFLTLAKNSGGGDLPDRTYTIQYAKDPANTSWDNDAAMKLYKQVMAKYNPNARVTDALNYYGVATAHAFVQLMYSAGKNPTRASLMQGVPHLERGQPVPPAGQPAEDEWRRPAADRCERIVKYTNGTFQPVSKLKCDGAAT